MDTFETRLDAIIADLNEANNKVPCKENGIALHHLQQARKALDDRTSDRAQRQVTGTQIA